MGDYRVEFGAGSLLRFGKVAPSGEISTFTEAARSIPTGFLYFNLRSEDAFGQPALGKIEFAHFELQAAPFAFFGPAPDAPLGRIRFVTSTTSVMLARARGRVTSVGHYEIPAGRLLIAARASIDGEPGGAEIISQGPVIGTFDPVASTFALDGAGSQNDGTAVIFHLVGQITNHPPVANAGGDHVAECGGESGAQVALDGRASWDPDPGDSVFHHQWFERRSSPEPSEPDEIVEFDVGVGTGAQLTTTASLGEHRFQLHVYDSHRGSGSDEVRVQVVDTIPPDLSFNPTVCLWPPNHDFMRFGVGDVLATASDQCDATPSLRIISVEASEPADAPGSGNTPVDVVHGPTTACVRAERSGIGPGRLYRMVVEATDKSGNAARQEFNVFVPHDQAEHPECVHAGGVDQPDESCTQ